MIYAVTDMTYDYLFHCRPVQYSVLFSVCGKVVFLLFAVQISCSYLCCEADACVCAMKADRQK